MFGWSFFPSFKPISYDVLCQKCRISRIGWTFHFLAFILWKSWNIHNSLNSVVLFFTSKMHFLLWKMLLPVGKLLRVREEKNRWVIQALVFHLWWGTKLVEPFLLKSHHLLFFSFLFANKFFSSRYDVSCLIAKYLKFWTQKPHKQMFFDKMISANNFTRNWKWRP